MLSRQIRHWVVALSLVAAVGITAASAAGSAGARHHAPRNTASLPVANGDLGEVVVVAPQDLGEVIVRLPHDLDDVMVEVRQLPPAGQYLADVVVTSRPVGGYANAAGKTATFALAR